MITLRPRATDISFDAAQLPLHDFRELSQVAIERLPVVVDNASIQLGDLLQVQGERSDRIRIEDVTAGMHGLGSGLRHGELVIDGDAGERTGAGMSGGRILVHGNVGDAAGLGMQGGSLVVEGNAGHYFAAAAPGSRRGMKGGEAIVRGSAGREAGARARRGTVVIGGHAGPGLARDIIAGTVLVLGPIDGPPGEGSRRGSVVAFDEVQVPATYRYACAFEPVWLRVLFRHLERIYHLPPAPGADGTWQRFCGDVGSPGKGELLVLVRP